MFRTKIKKYYPAAILVVVSTLVSLALGEAVVQTVLEPGDYLKAQLEEDPILGHRIKPNSSGHDSWGFRNKAVPASVKIVAIGDSQTYGIGAAASNSWPANLQRMTDEEVYNLSLGGYGPAQYYHLLTHNALRLHPSTVIIGFYFGNDLFDAYNSVYTKNYWKYLRRSDFVVADTPPTNVPVSKKRPRLLADARRWLAHHSILYRMLTFSYGNMFRFFEMKYRYSEISDVITVLADDEQNIQTAFTPKNRLNGLRLTDPKIDEGLRLTLELFRKMHDECANNGIDFLTVLIPTKESVFAEYIENNKDLKNWNVLEQVITSEGQINELVKAFFDQHGIAYTDVLPELREAAAEKNIYPSNEDGHPNAAGYQVIAKAAQKRLSELNARKGSLATSYQ